MKGFFLFPAIFSFICVWIILTHGYWLSIAAGVYFLFRLYWTKNTPIFFFSCIFAVLISGVTVLEDVHNQTSLSGNEQHFQVYFKKSETKMDGNLLQFYGTVKQTDHKKSISERIVVFYSFQSEAEKEKWQNEIEADRVVISGQLIEPENNRNFGQFNYRNFLYRKKIHWILQATDVHFSSAKQLKKRNDHFFETAKASVSEHIDAIFPIKIGGYIKTLWLGERGSFDQDMSDDFKNLGILHLLSISGLHIQFIFAGLSFFLLRLGLSKEKTYGILMISLFAFGSFIGWGTSSFRAVLTTMISITTKRFYLPLTSLDAWSVTLLLALWIDPYQIFLVGFQLSYLLSLTLLLFSPSYLKARTSYLLDNLKLSMLMTVSSIPILILHFYEFPWIGILANLLFVPFFSWLLFPLLILLLLSYMVSTTKIFHFFVAIFSYSITGIEKLASWMSAIPFSVIVTGKVSAFVLVILTIALLNWLLALESGKKRKTTTAVLVILLGLILFFQHYPFLGKIVMIDIGQGEAILIKSPGSKGNYLIDTGGKIQYEQENWKVRKQAASLTEKTLIPVLKAYGVTSLDQVLITHGDMDHFGELAELSENIPIKALVYPEGVRKKALFDVSAEKLATTGTRLIEVLADQAKTKQIGPGLIILWPLEEGKGENNDSLVLYGKFGEHYWLFTGDLEEAGERAIIKQYPHLKVDVLKVGHHGSHTSTSKEWVDFLKPTFSLISVGKNNSFGHPHPEILKRLEKQQCTIYRTDQDGSIIFTYREWPMFKKTGVFTTLLK